MSFHPDDPASDLVTFLIIGGDGNISAFIPFTTIFFPLFVAFTMPLRGTLICYLVFTLMTDDSDSITCPVTPVERYEHTLT